MWFGFVKKKSNWIGRLEVFRVSVPPVQSPLIAKRPASDSNRVMFPSMAEDCVMFKTPMGDPPLSVPMDAVNRPAVARNSVGGNWNPSYSKAHVPTRRERGLAGHTGAT